MSRSIPHPLLSLALWLMWMLLNSFSLGHALLGAVIALIAGWSLSAIEPRGPRVMRILPGLRLFVLVAGDILRSNFAVASLILTGGRRGQRHSGFVQINLRISDPTALAILSIIITATPGTAWLEYDEESGVLLLHVFDLLDDQEWQVLIRDRYEERLMEMFR